MSKQGRNDPCSCGSGKKFKKCCEGKPTNSAAVHASGPWNGEPTLMTAAGTPNRATEFLQQFRAATGDRIFESEEELKRAIAAFQHDTNHIGLLDFLGLSPDQMHRISHQPIEASSDIVELRFPSTVPMFIDAPIVKIALSIMIHVVAEGSLKMTSKGNLPMKVVKEIHSHVQELYDLMAPSLRSEEDLPELFIVRNLLELAGITVFENGRLRLTDLGAELLDIAISEKNAARLYRHLFINYVNRLNWLICSPLDDEFAHIQRTALFNLYILHKKAAGYVNESTLAKIYARAFPILGELVARKKRIPRGRTPDDVVADGFLSLFVYQFCWLFALLNQRHEKSTNEIEFVVSKLFQQIFHWKI